MVVMAIRKCLQILLIVHKSPPAVKNELALGETLYMDLTEEKSRGPKIKTEKSLFSIEF